MKITFLGTSHGVPEVNRRCQSIMFEVGDKVYFVDMGTQSIEGLITRKIPIESVKSVFLTHMHGDHTNGLISFVDLCSWYFKEAKPSFYIPGSGEKAKELIGAWLEFNDSHIRDFEFNTVKEGLFYDDGNIKVTAYRTKHSAFSYSYVIEAENKRILVTGDFCGEGPVVDFPISVLDKPVDVAICECVHFGAGEYSKVLKGNENLKKMVIVHYNDKESSKIAINKLKEDLNMPFIVAVDGFELTV
ncbi:MAG: ribonuclease Z [Ruminococcaceae bacterium]|nr:ribonuclease Z [Oscillospiraceae bacterium]